MDGFESGFWLKVTINAVPWPQSGFWGCQRLWGWKIEVEKVEVKVKEMMIEIGTFKKDVSRNLEKVRDCPGAFRNCSA